MTEQIVSRKALIIDDDYAFAQFAEILLAQYGFKSLISLESERAMEVAATQEPDVILMDIRMPDLNGIEAVKKLKSNPTTKDIPIILCSISKDRSEVEKAMELGATQFLRKPLKNKELKACLDKAGIGP